MRFVVILFLSLLFSTRLHMGECARTKARKLNPTPESAALSQTKFNIHWSKFEVVLFSENEVKEKEEALSKWNSEFQENFRTMLGCFLNMEKWDLPETYSKLTLNDLSHYSEISLLDATLDYIRTTEIAFGTVRGQDLADFLTPIFDDLRRDEARSEKARTAYFEQSREEKEKRRDKQDAWQPWWNDKEVWLPYAYARYKSLDSHRDTITLNLLKTNDLFNTCAKIIRIFRFYQEQAKRAEGQGSHVGDAHAVLEKQPLAAIRTQEGASTSMQRKRKASEGLGSIQTAKAQPKEVNERPSIDTRAPSSTSSAFQVLPSHSHSQHTFSKHTEGVTQRKLRLTPIYKLELVARPASNDPEVLLFLANDETIFPKCIRHVLVQVDKNAANEDFSQFYEKWSVTHTNADPLVEVSKELLHRIQKKERVFNQVKNKGMVTVLEEGLDMFTHAAKSALLVLQKHTDMNRPSSEKGETSGNAADRPSPRKSDRITIELPNVVYFFKNRDIRVPFEFSQGLQALQTIYLKHHYYRRRMASLQSESPSMENIRSQEGIGFSPPPRTPGRDYTWRDFYVSGDTRVTSDLSESSEAVHWIPRTPGHSNGLSS